MSPTEIRACLERANAVLDGFKRPSEQNARDVVALLRHYNGAKQSKTDTKKPEMPDCFKDLFGFKCN